jgi:hypothetical protein
LAAVQIQNLFTGSGCTTSLDRALGAGGASDYWARIEMMRQALMVWWSHPILGVGAGKFMATAFALEPRRDVFLLLDYFPHNSPLEILASFGLLGAVPLVLCGAFWIVRAWRNRLSSRQQWPMLAGLVVLSIHAMLEMPLWYLYFLIPFGLMLGIAVGPSQASDRSVALPWHWLCVCSALIGVPGFIHALNDHARAERILWLGHLAKDQPALSGGAIAAIGGGVRDLTIFRIAGDRELLRFADISLASAPTLSIANKRLMENIPDPLTIGRQVMLEAIAGRPDDARDLFRRLMTFFPRHYELLAPEIRKRAEDRPEEVGDLAKMIDEEMARPPKPRR